MLDTIGSVAEILVDLPTVDLSLDPNENHDPCKRV